MGTARGFFGASRARMIEGKHGRFLSLMNDRCSTLPAIILTAERRK
jgi:hypothetical protein